MWYDEETVVTDARPTVAIVILNWNNYDDTAECLSSLESVEYPNTSVVVVDNGSEDDSINRLREEYPWASYILSETNRGFAGGNNVGIRHALETGTDYVLLLNNDTVVSEDFLEPLVSVAEADDTVGIVGGVIEEYNSDAIWYAGATFYPLIARARHLRTVERDVPYSTGYITGACMLISRGVIEEIGMLNEEYFFGLEDVEYSRLAVAHGWELRVVPRSRIEHKVSSTAGENSTFWLQHRTSNRLRFAKNNLNLVSRAIFYVLFVGMTFLEIVYWFVTDNEPIERLRAVIRGARQ